MPFAVQIAQHEGYPPQIYIGEALRGDVRIFVFWDDNIAPVGALATQFLIREDGARVGILHWIAGEGILRTLPEWLPRIEHILAHEHAITRFQVTGREGWVRTLKPLGYRCRKVILEKGLETNA